MATRPSNPTARTTHALRDYLRAKPRRLMAPPTLRARYDAAHDGDIIACRTLADRDALVADVMGHPNGLGSQSAARPSPSTTQGEIVDLARLDCSTQRLWGIVA